jgi:hypothetical protein
MAIFRQLLSQLGACNQKQNCFNTDNGPMDALDQMQQALNEDPQTSGGLATPVRSTDIKWYP